MMVGDDQIDAAVGGDGGLLDGRDPAIDADDQAGAAVAKGPMAWAFRP